MSRGYTPLLRGRARDSGRLEAVGCLQLPPKAWAPLDLTPG